MRIGNQGRVEIKNDDGVWLLRDAIVVSESNNFKNLYKNIRNYEWRLEELCKTKDFKEVNHFIRANHASYVHHQQDLNASERFFHSDWFTFLTEIDGDYIIKKIKEVIEHEHEEEIKEKMEKLQMEICDNASVEE